jgi:hypothetical protein
MKQFFEGYSVRNWSMIIPLVVLVWQACSIHHYNAGLGGVLFSLFFLLFFIISVQWGESHSSGCAKIIVALITLITPAITFALYGNHGEEIIFTLPFIGCFVCAFSSGICTGIYRQTHNEKWYRKTYPHCVSERKKESHKHGKTRIACYHCNSGYLKGQNMMNRTWTRRMYCGDCGTTLFYAGEER